jgi:hypothetical protein
MIAQLLNEAVAVLRADDDAELVESFERYEVFSAYDGEHPAFARRPEPADLISWHAEAEGAPLSR